MVEFSPILTQAILALPSNSAEARSLIYDNARAALIKSIKSADKKASKQQIEAISLKLEDAILEVETEEKFRERYNLSHDHLDSSHNQPIHEPSHQQLSNQNVDAVHTFRPNQKGTLNLENKLRISFEDLLLSQIKSNEKSLTDQTGVTIEKELQPVQTGRKLLSASLTLLAIFIVLATLVFGRWGNVISHFENAGQIFGLQNQGENLNDEVISNAATFNSLGSIEQENQNFNEKISKGINVDSNLSTNAALKNSNKNTIINNDESQVFGQAIATLFYDAALNISTPKNVNLGEIKWSIETKANTKGENVATLQALIRPTIESSGIVFSMQPASEENSNVSHFIDIQVDPFDKNFESEIKNIAFIDVKSTGDEKGITLSGKPKKISEDHFQIVFPTPAQACNLSLLQEREIIEFPIEFISGKLAKVRLVKGDEGSKVFDTVLANWRDKLVEKVPHCALIYEETSALATPELTFGEVVWDAANNIQSEQVFTGINAAVNFHHLTLGSQISIKPNFDSNLDASHIVEIKFEIPNHLNGGGVKEVNGIIVKNAEHSLGNNLLTVSSQVNSHLSWVALSKVGLAEERNKILLSGISWIEFPMIFNNDKAGCYYIGIGVRVARVYFNLF